MNVLPVIVRELRAESRQGFTYWLRVLGAALMLLVAVLFVAERGTGLNRGDELFFELHLTLYFAIWIFVPIVVADCLSRERREGTLGLLFLTPLRAWDIVVAKALAHGLRAAALGLAVLPVLALPFLMGGVGWWEGVLSALTNFSAFWWALSAGLLASARSKRWLRAVVGAVLLGVAFHGAFLLANLVLVGANVYARLGGGGFQALTALVVGSPLTSAWDLLELAFALVANIPLCLGVNATAGTQTRWLWYSAVGAALAPLVLLIATGMAARLVRRHWQEEPPSARRLWWQAVFCTPVLWKDFFRRWLGRRLERNPIGWLEQRTWSGRLLVWSWLAVLLSVYSAVLSDWRMFRRSFDLIQHGMACLLIGSVAFTAAGSFRRERETGVLELLLVTPLGVREIVFGRLRGVWGQFAPVVLVMAAIWLYLEGTFRGDQGVVWLFFYLACFATLPVTGLYASLRWSNIFGAFLATLGFGLLAPVLLPFVLFQLGCWGPPVGGRPFTAHDHWAAAFFLAPLVQLFVAGVIGARLQRDLQERRGAMRLEPGRI